MSDADPQPTKFKPEADLSGRRLGDYHLIRRLGRGGMAEVYLAEQGSLRRQVAFKVLRAELAQQETYVRRFHNEAQAAAALVHANIVQIYEVGCLEGTHFIAQEYVAGKNLQQVLARKGPLDIKLAVNILRQIAAALLRAAERGVTHRDIKPENVLLTASGEVKVADFGLARVTSSDGKVDLTQVGITMGTPLFMSPEQVEGATIDPRSDLYSLGVTAYQMLAGRPPFEGETPLSVAIQHLNNSPKPLTTWRPDLEPALATIVHKLLAKKPADRYQSAAELLRELRDLQVEGLEEGWPTDVELWSPAAFNSPVTEKLAATQRLQTAMLAETQKARTVRQRWRKSRWLVIGWCALVLPAAFSAGLLVAWLNRPALLLGSASTAALDLQQKETVAEQFAYAQELWTVPAFLSVLKQFPPQDSRENELYGYRAKLQLAYLYEADQPAEAMRYYNELAEQNQDSQLKAFGLIGAANLHSRNGHRAAAAQCVDAVASVLATQDLMGQRNRQEWLQRWTQRLDPALREDLTNAIQTKGPAPGAPQPGVGLGI